MTLPASFFHHDAEAVARKLIGVQLLVDGVGGIIVETEAYDAGDAASHTFRGKTKRNAVMFDAPGHVYVYLIYGLHWCLNFVCGPAGSGAAVLIRAIEPLAGLDEMRRRRRLDDPRQLCSGPGKLCEALGITGQLNGHKSDEPPFDLQPAKIRSTLHIGPRIGITLAPDTPWRFGLVGSAFLSRPFKP